MHQPGPLPYRPPPKTSTTGPKVLTTIGAVMAVLGLVTGAIAALLVVTGIGDLNDLDTFDTSVDAAAITTVEPGQTHTAVLEARTRYTLWAKDVEHQPAAAPVVVAPGGTTPPVSPWTYTVNGATRYGWTFTSSQAGAYEVTAPEEGPTVAVVPGPELDALISGVTGLLKTVIGTVLVFIAAVVGLPGLAMAIGGGIWWSACTTRTKVTNTAT